MKNILVPTDFSSASGNAARYAAALARAFGAKLTVVNVVAPSVIIDDSVLASVMITQAEILAENRQLLQEQVENLSKEFSIEVDGSVAEGFPSDMIPQLATAHNAACMVMGMKGKGKSHSLFGSTTTTLIRKSDFPIFVIPEEATFAPIFDITFASDFDATIEIDRYRVLLALAKQFNSKINILNVQKEDCPLSLKEVTGKLQTSNAFSAHDHRFRSITEHNVEEGIQRFIETNNTDLLVMMARKHSFFERIFGKIHTRAMSYQTKIPLLVLHNK